MKPLFKSTLIGLGILFALVLTACAPGSASVGGNCQQGICVNVQLSEPIRFNESTVVTITVETDKDEVGLQIGMNVPDPEVVVDGQHIWIVNTKSHQPIQVTSIIHFPSKEGYFDVIGGVVTRLGSYVSDAVYVHLTSAGGTINPTMMTPEERTPQPTISPSKIPVPLSQVFSPPSKPTPWNRQLTPIQPNDLFTRCGWSSSSIWPNRWEEDAKVWIEIPESVPMNTPVSVVVGFESPRKSQKTAQAVIALCINDPSIQIVGQREWKYAAQPGTVVTVTTTLLFKQAGEFSILGAAYDPATSQITGGGESTQVTTSSSAAPNQPTGCWSLMITQTFEGYFPPAGWTVQDLSNDGRDIYWDDSNYRYHTGSWAGWPARGGANGINPFLTNTYTNYMNTRMIYGPFDLSDAVMADTDFYLWRDIETCCDYIAFEISHDGVAFQELARWTGSSGWEFKDIYYNDYVGDNSVWVAWRFYSDSSVVYQGPWVDDIRVWKYVPGQVTARGSFSYADRNNLTLPASYTKVYLYDSDPGGSDDLLAQTTTYTNGNFEFSPIRNWDVDDPNQSTYTGRLDLYITWESDLFDSYTDRRRVTNFVDQPYQWYSVVETDASDGTADFYNYFVPFNDLKHGAMLIFQDLRRAWEYIHNTTGTNPGSTTVRWQKDQDALAPCLSGSCFWPYVGINGVFIADKDVSSSDAVVHETAHQYMYNTRGGWDVLACLNHSIFAASNALCGWTEGWGDFLPLPVNGDPSYTFANGVSFNLETQDRSDGLPQGDTVEGRVAGALYDLLDSADDGYDHAIFGFGTIWDLVSTGSAESSFSDFWNSWKSSGYLQHKPVQAIYQNTINYNTPPTIANLPDRTVLQNFSWNNAIDLWDFSSDPESTDQDLAWSIPFVTDIRCGIGINAHYINIVPQTNWLGMCDATVQVSDGITNTKDIFRVNVVPVAARIYLPIILKDSDTQALNSQTPPTTFISPLPIPEQPAPFESPLPVP